MLWNEEANIVQFGSCQQQGRLYLPNSLSAPILLNKIVFSVAWESLLSLVATRDAGATAVHPSSSSSSQLTLAEQVLQLLPSMQQQIDDVAAQSQQTCDMVNDLEGVYASLYIEVQNSQDEVSTQLEVRSFENTRANKANLCLHHP